VARTITHHEIFVECESLYTGSLDLEETLALESLEEFVVVVA